MAKHLTTDELKAAIAALHPIKQRRRFTSELRAAVLRYARPRLAQGVSARVICAELDIGEPTLARFLSSAPPTAFSQVKIIEPAATPVVRGPCGLVIEGLTLDGVAQLIRGLACSA